MIFVQHRARLQFSKVIPKGMHRVLLRDPTKLNLIQTEQRSRHELQYIESPSVRFIHTRIGVVEQAGAHLEPSDQG